MFTLSRPDYTSPEWEALTNELQSDVRNWLDAFSSRPDSGITKWLTRVAESMGTSYQTARRKYDALRKNNGDWTVLIDGRKAAPAADKIDGITARLK
jgi:hypothetical protein